MMADLGSLIGTVLSPFNRWGTPPYTSWNPSWADPRRSIRRKYCSFGRGM